MHSLRRAEAAGNDEGVGEEESREHEARRGGGRIDWVGGGVTVEKKEKLVKRGGD